MQTLIEHWEYLARNYNKQFPLTVVITNGQKNIGLVINKITFDTERIILDINEKNEKFLVSNENKWLVKYGKTYNNQPIFTTDI
ncbi:hypothetical protein KKC17_04090 [Patescibacteria group bacterium]|nr:hypothetical protein [Patescibacteria group bacterium]